MRILLHNPDNGIAGSLMPHLRIGIGAMTRTIEAQQAWTVYHGPAATRRAMSNGARKLARVNLNR